MKKINAFLIICMMLCLLITSPDFVDRVDAINQHESTNGETYGIIDKTIPTELTDFDNDVYTVAFSKDNMYCAISGKVSVGQSGSDVVKVYWISNWTLCTTITNFPGIESDILDMDFSYDSEYLAVGTEDNNPGLHLFWVSNWTKIIMLEVGGFDAPDGGDIDMVTFSPDNNYLAFSDSDCDTDDSPGDETVIHIYNQGTWTYVKNVSYVTGNIGIGDGEFSADSNWLAICGYYSFDNPKRVQIYDVTDSFNLETEFDPPGFGNFDDLYGLAFAKDNSHLVVCGETNKAFIYNQGGGWTYETTITESSVLQDADFSYGNDSLAISGNEGKIRFYDMNTWNLNWTTIDKGRINDIDFLSDNINIVAGSNDNVAYVFDIINHSFVVNRTTSLIYEFNNFSFTPTYDVSGNITLKVPVSTEITGITSVTNNTDSIEATEVNTTDELTNNTYWYDSANQYVNIRTINLTITSPVNWSLNCTHGTEFSILLPEYLEVGDYFMSSGLITDADGVPLSGLIATTRLLLDGIDAIDPPHKWNCSDGNYWCIISTSSLEPNTYTVSVEFTDPDSGITHKEGGILYLSVNPGSGVYVSTFLHFAFYNNNTGIGIPSESFKIYSSTDTTIDSTDRIYVDSYGVYTGQTIYYRVDDYFDNQIYPSSGDYETLVITSTEQFEDVPIDWYSFSVKNMNHSIVKFNITNSSRTYSQFLYPYEPFYWNVLGGDYNISMEYYNPVSGAYEQTLYDDITITDDTYYWIVGYDLRDIIIEITNTNTTIMDQIINIGVTINNDGANIINQTINLAFWLSNIETNITSQVNSVWFTVNNTKTTVITQANLVKQDITNFHTNITDQLNAVWQNVNNTESEVTNQANTIKQDIDNINTNFTNQVNAMWQDVNTSNSTIHTQVNNVVQDVDNLNTNITTQVNYVRQDISLHNSNLTTQVNAVQQSITNANTTIHTQLNAVIQDVVNLDTNLTTQVNTVTQDIINFETNITTQVNGVSISIENTETNITNQLNIIETDIDNSNTSIHTQINAVTTQVTNTETNIIDQVNYVRVDIENHDVNLTNQINSVTIEIQNSNTSIHTQLNAIQTTISNNHVGMIDQVNLVWNELNNTNSTINTQINGVYNSINTFWSNVNTTFTVVRSDITYAETNITNWINGTNATLLAKLLSVLDNVSSAGMSVFDRVEEMAGVVDDVMSDIGNITDNISFNLSVGLSEVLQNLTYVLQNISLTVVSIGNLVNITIGDLSNVTIQMWEQQNDSFSDLQDRSLVIFNFHNTNQGLGLDRETLRIYINGSRLIDNVHYCDNGSTINLTIKDYYNFTLYHNNYTITAPFTFIDAGITFHSWLFGNHNPDYYMISLLKQGGSRWWERGIIKEREFMIPSGNYMMRIYDKDWVEIYNSSTYESVVNSRVYVIYGVNLSEIISGQSVIRGQLLELSSELYDATMPDVVITVHNPPTVCSVFDRDGQILDGFRKICPAQYVWATTYNETTSALVTSCPLIPVNNSANGSISISYDELYLSGPGNTSVNITYTDNGTVLSDTSYIPNKIILYGENITITASTDITILRETRYQQFTKFFWYWDTYTNKNSATINVNNPLNVNLREVAVYAEYNNQSTPQRGTIAIRDIHNNVMLPYGEDFRADDTGVDFRIRGSVVPGETRKFTITYTGINATATYEGDASDIVETFDIVNWDGNAYNHFDTGWVNTESNTYKGPLHVILNFSEAINILPNRIRVYDKENDRELPRLTVYYGGNTLTINPEAMGEILPGGGRNFDVYFLVKPTESGITEVNLNSVIFAFRVGEVVVLFTWAILFCIILFVLAVLCFIRYTKFSISLGALCIMGMILLIILSFA